MRRWLAIGVAGAVVAGALVVIWPVRADAVLLHGTFVDDNGSPHENGIEALALAEITSGCNPPANSRFCPNSDVTRAEAATFLTRALGLSGTGTDFFVDDNGHILEEGINRMAAAGLTVGCNPPTNDRFCPERSLTRAEFATFIARALDLPNTNEDFFIDDEGHVLEGPINRIAEAGITVGCNPPTNNRFCPNRVLTRGETATLLTRALNLPHNPQRIPLANWSPVNCGKGGTSCTMIVDTFAGRTHMVQEGFFQVLPYKTGEQDSFTSSNTTFTLLLDGDPVSTTQLPIATSSTQALRRWNTVLVFSAGTHTLVGEWRWNGALIQRTTATIRAD